MTLRIRLHDKTSYQGWFFLLRPNDDCPQPAMTLEVHRDPSEARMYYVEMGFVFPEVGKPICMATANKGTYVIERPDILISMVNGSTPATPEKAESTEEPPPEADRKTLSLVA